MKLPKIRIDFRKIGRVLKHHLPSILSIAGCIGVPVTAYLSGRAALKAKEVLDAQPEDSSFQDDFKAVAKYYVPPVVTGIATMGSIVGSNCIHLKRNAALTAAGAALAKYVMDLRQSVAEKLGEDKLAEIDAERAAELAKDKEFPKELEDDEFVLYEPLTETLFVTSQKKLDDAERILNYEFQKNTSVSLTEFLILASGEPPEYKYGDLIGWSKDNLIQSELWYGWQGFEWIDWTIMENVPTAIGIVNIVHFHTEPLPLYQACNNKEVIDIFGEGLEQAMYDY